MGIEGIYEGKKLINMMDMIYIMMFFVERYFDPCHSIVY